jgi:hypothetical protein
MTFTGTAISFGARAVGFILRKGWEWGVIRSAPLLSIKMEEFEAEGMLRAFDVTLSNDSKEAIRLREIYVRIPQGANLAIRWRPLMFYIDEGPRYAPWDLTPSYSINTTLDPGEKYDCEIGLPAGFAISASRQSPVTVSLRISTLGSDERTITQDIKRRIEA